MADENSKKYLDKAGLSTYTQQLKNKLDEIYSTATIDIEDDEYRLLTLYNNDNLICKVTLRGNALNNSVLLTDESGGTYIFRHDNSIVEILPGELLFIPNNADGMIALYKIDNDTYDYMFTLEFLNRLESVKYINLGNTTDLSFMFEEQDITAGIEMDTSKVTNMNSMFYSCSKLQEIPLYNTSNVEDMGYMFAYCSKLQEIPLLDTSNVTDAQFMFYKCESLSTLPALDFSNVTNAQYMFARASSLTSIPDMKFANLINADYMFDRTAITEMPQLDLSTVKTAENMFCACTSLKEIICDTSNIENMRFFATGNDNLKKIHLDCSSCTDLESACSSNPTLKEVTLLNTGKVRNMTSMLAYNHELETINEIDCASCLSMYNAFRECQKLKTITLKNTNNVQVFNRCFNHNPTNLEAVYGIDVSSCTDCTYMFNNCQVLKYIELTANSADKIRFIVNNSWLPNHAGAAENEYIIDISGCSSEVLAELTDLSKPGWTFQTSAE